jgi:Winged helix-turn-helix domain (DUF2582)
LSNVIDEFGQSAGKVWQALNIKGPLSETKLINTTFLNEHQVHAAVGWLARENKICQNGTVYKIGWTNLEGKIGFDAGKVWTVLAKQHTNVGISSLARLTRINVNDVFAAIGWLARENKIEAKAVKNKKSQQLKVSLK